jgi:hypothetical protein
VVASLSPAGLFSWTRDAALVFKDIINGIVQSPDILSQGLIDIYSVVEAVLQQEPNLSRQTSQVVLESRNSISMVPRTTAWGSPRRRFVPELRNTSSDLSAVIWACHPDAAALRNIDDLRKRATGQQ